MRISINAVSPYEGGGFNTYNKYIIQSICKIDKKNDYFIFVDSNNFDQHKINQSNVKIIKKNKILNNSVLRILWMQLILPIELIKLDIDTHLSTMNILPFLLSAQPEDKKIYSFSPPLIPDKKITAIATDNTGLNWIGTLGGLICYNGKRWHTITSKNSKLPSDKVLSIKIVGNTKYIVITTISINKIVHSIDVVSLNCSCI